MKKIINNYLKKVWYDSAYLNNEFFAAHVEPAEYIRVLDVGCDNGKICRDRFRSKIKKSIICGTDINPRKLASAKKLGIKTILADAEKRLPFPDNYFNLVTANQIIEHLVDSDNFIGEIYRVLKPNGYLIISTENLASWHNIGALIMGWHPFSLHVSRKNNIGNPLRLGNYFYDDLAGCHIKNFTLKSLSELCQLHKFTVEKSFGAGYYPFSGIISRFLSMLDPNHTAFIGLKTRKK